MDEGDWISASSGGVALVAAGFTLWQARTAAASAEHAKTQAEAVDQQVLVAREQLQQAERAHREQLALAQRVYREQNEPYVVVDIAAEAPGSGLLVLVIQNSGPTMARNVRVRFVPDLESSLPSLTARLHRALSRPIPVLPPGRRLVYAFDTHQRWQANLPMEFDVTVDADGPAGAVEQLTYRIDIDILGESMIGERPHKRIEEKIGKVADALNHFNKRYEAVNELEIRATAARGRREAEERQRRRDNPDSSS